MIYTKDKEYLIEFGKNLKTLREAKGFSQEELANRAEVSLPQITRIERGVVNPTICTVKLLADGLSIDIQTLFNFSYKK